MYIIKMTLEIYDRSNNFIERKFWSQTSWV